MPATDVLQVQPRAEGITGAGDADDPRPVIRGGFGDSPDEPPRELVRERVLHLRPVHPDGPDPVLLRNLDDAHRLPPMRESAPPAWRTVPPGRKRDSRPSSGCYSRLAGGRARDG